jgi:hypothetical protein
VDWIDPAQDMDKWRVVGNKQMKILFRKMKGLSWLPEEISVSK